MERARSITITRMTLGLTAVVLVCAAPAKQGGSAAEQASPFYRTLTPTLTLGADETAHVDGLLYRPGDVVITDTDSHFVLDAGNSRIAQFDEAGNFIDAFGRPGQGPGEFDFMTPSDTLQGSADELFTMNAVSFEVQSWSVEGDHRDRFRFGTRAPDMAATTEHIYFATLGFDNVPGLTRTSHSGEPEATWQRVLYIGHTPSAPRLNIAEIAVAPDGEVLMAFHAWPLLWRVADLAASSSHEHRWLDFEWLPDIPAREKLARPESLLRDRDIVPVGHPEMAWVTFWDIEYVPGHDAWYLLSSQNLLHVVDRDLEPLGTYELLPAPGEESAELWALGISRNGRRACAVDAIEPVVRCYALGAAS